MESSGETSSEDRSVQLSNPALSPITEHEYSAHMQPISTTEWSAGTRGDPENTYDPARKRGVSGEETRLSIRVSSLEPSHAGALGSSKAEARSPSKPQELAFPDSLPPRSSKGADHDTRHATTATGSALGHLSARVLEPGSSISDSTEDVSEITSPAASQQFELASVIDKGANTANVARPYRPTRSASTPLISSKPVQLRSAKPNPQSSRLKTSDEHHLIEGNPKPPLDPEQSSPIPPMAPLPPLSLPIYLELELAPERASPLYAHRPVGSDTPYESSKVKFERLLNFFLLPPILERVLVFGALTCLDAWLYTFTILPLRFIKAVWILVQWIGVAAGKEACGLGPFVYEGMGRVWNRRRESSVASRRPSLADGGAASTAAPPFSPNQSTSRLSSFTALTQSPTQEQHLPLKRRSRFGRRRTRPTTSALLPNHKADILHGLLIVLSCAVLTRFDASRMYHSIRGQGAIKLYVIYNALEVFDRLLSALGQDVLECLTSKETLERDAFGRSKLLRPLGMFTLALVYNVIHATALFYQVITLNVAVNSYSNALLTLLLSNQFVEIKGAVFKKFEKETLFQLTCADVVERFQLWLMLLIIALRNIVEIGGLSLSPSSAIGSGNSPSSPTATAFSANATDLPLTSGSILPRAFMMLPKFAFEVLTPFLIVLGSEMLVDWCKHAYITRFNNLRPNIYGRFLDVLAKDYYSHAFADQNLNKRLGLPIMPLSCLFIRAAWQTWGIFAAAQAPMPPSTGISADPSEIPTSSPATTAAFQHVDHMFRRPTFSRQGGSTGSSFASYGLDDFFALFTTVTLFSMTFCVLLTLKLMLGMLLLSYSRARYRSMKKREKAANETLEGAKRVGGWGTVEVDDAKRRWIHVDDPTHSEGLRERAERGRQKSRDGSGLQGVQRYVMSGKRIW